MTSDYTSKVQQLNDAFRKTLTGGQTYMTSGVTALATSVTTEALALVRGFDVFTTENDPYGEHDFGSVTVDGTKLFWKIDHYDLSFQYLLIPQGQISIIPIDKNVSLCESVGRDRAGADRYPVNAREEIL